MTVTGINAQPIALGSIKKLGSLNLQVYKLPPEWAGINAVKEQYKIPVGKPDNHPDNIYATVKVNGKVVATLYNSGGAEMSNAGYGRIKNLPSMGKDEKLIGPALAQKRADEIAKALGGTVEKNSTAQNQAQWQNRPAQEWTYDYKAIAEAEKRMNEQIEASLKLRYASAETQVNAQLMAQGSGLFDS